MERLTRKFVQKINGRNEIEVVLPAERTVQEAVNRLAELEDKIENGTLVELPCKVGNCVYRICSFIGRKETFIMPAQIIAIELYQDGVLYRIYNDNGLTEYLFGDTFNNSWFLTREEAEKRLEELKGC